MGFASPVDLWFWQGAIGPLAVRCKLLGGEGHSILVVFLFWESNVGCIATRASSFGFLEGGLVTVCQSRGMPARA